MIQDWLATPLTIGHIAWALGAWLAIHMIRVMSWGVAYTIRIIRTARVMPAIRAKWAARGLSGTVLERIVAAEVRLRVTGRMPREAHEG